MAFVKTDLDAALGDEPFDQFLLGRAEGNARACREHRLHVGGKVWGSPRPKYGCVNTHTFLPVALPLSGLAQTVEVKWRLIVGGGGSVFVRPALYDPVLGRCTPRGLSEEDRSEADVQELTDSSGAQITVTTSYSVGEGGPRVVFLGLHIQSDWGGVAENKTNFTGPHAADLLGYSDGVLALDEAYSGGGTPPWQSYDPDTRYALQITQHSGATGGEGPHEKVFDLVRAAEVAGDLYVVVSPTIYAGDVTLQDDFAIDWREIGWIELHSFAAYEVAQTPPHDLRLETGFPPASDPITALHSDLLRLHRQAVAVRCISSTEDTESLDVDGEQVNSHGAQVSCNDSTYRPIAGVLLGQQGGVDETYEVASSTTYTRTRFGVAGLIAVGACANADNGASILLSFRAKTGGRVGGGPWTNDEEILPDSSNEFARVEVPIQQPNWNRGNRNGVSFDYTDYIALSRENAPGTPRDFRPVAHLLKGLWPTASFGLSVTAPPPGLDRLRPGGCGLTPFYFELDDSATETEARFLRLEVKGRTTSVQGQDLRRSAPWAYLVALTIFPLQEVI